MEPSLKPYFDHVWPLFWPWLWLNLIRFALWHQRTGQEALLTVDCFGNIRIAFLCDAPQADDLYDYDAPAVTSWQRLAPGFALPELVNSTHALPEIVRPVTIPVRTVSGLFADPAVPARGPP
ncbi:MAG: hypothetical protein R3B98_09365 [Hyphomonas sp.]